MDGGDENQRIQGTAPFQDIDLRGGPSFQSANIGRAVHRNRRLIGEEGQRRITNVVEAKTERPELIDVGDAQSQSGVGDELERVNAIGSGRKRDMRRLRFAPWQKKTRLALLAIDHQLTILIIPDGSWLAGMLMRKPRMLVAIALANKMARQIWAMLTRNEDFRNPTLAGAA